MNTSLVLPEGVDKLSNGQKIFAGGLLSIFAVTIVYNIGAIVFMLANIWLAMLLAAPIIFMVFNPMIVWGLFKSVSYSLTKKIIGLDVLSAMDRYYDWVVSQYKELIEAKKELSVTLKNLQDQISEREISRTKNLEKADIADRSNKKVEAAIYASNAQTDTEFIKNLLPVREKAEQSLSYMEELAQGFEANSRQLKYQIDAKRIEFQSLEAMDKGMKAANAFLGNGSEARKIWETSVEILAQQMNTFAANIEQCKNNVLPALNDARMDKQIREEEGMRLLEEFRKNNFA